MQLLTEDQLWSDLNCTGPKNLKDKVYDQNDKMGICSGPILTFTFLNLVIYFYPRIFKHKPTQKLGPWAFARVKTPWATAFHGLIPHSTFNYIKIWLYYKYNIEYIECTLTTHSLWVCLVCWVDKLFKIQVSQLNKSTLPIQIFYLFIWYME